MTDKEKIRAEIVRLEKEWRLHNSAEGKYRCEAYKEILEFIDSLPKEPVSEDIVQKNFSKTMFDGLVTPEESLGVSTEEYSKIVNECVFGKEEPVSEDLEEAAKKVGQKYFPDENNIWARPNYEAVAAANSFKEGAKWQEEQMEKNRIEHCNNITEEQYNLETNFIDGHIKKYHRIPTILDAIEYGMSLKKGE